MFAIYNRGLVFSWFGRLFTWLRFRDGQHWSWLGGPTPKCLALANMSTKRGAATLAANSEEYRLEACTTYCVR